MTANGPNRPPLSRRAARHNDETVLPALGTEDDVLPPGMPDADDVEEPSTPRRARSTFTTERRRPHSASKPLPPLEPVIPDVDLTEPAARDRPAPLPPPARARVAVAPAREPDAPIATEIVVPPRPPLPEHPIDERPTRRDRRPRPETAVAAHPASVPEPTPEPEPAPEIAFEADEPSPQEPRLPLLRRLRRRITKSDDEAPSEDHVAMDAPEPEPEPEPELELDPEPKLQPKPEPELEPKPEPSALRPTRRSFRAAGPASAPTPTLVQPEPAPEAEPEPEADPAAHSVAADPTSAAPGAPVEEPLPKHAQTRRSTRMRTGLGLLVAAVLVMGSTVAVTAAVTADPVTDAGAVGARMVVEEERLETEASLAVPLPAPAQSIPAPEVTGAAAFVDVCSDPAFTAAIAAGEDVEAIALAGGGERFRAAVASGNAPCVPLTDPARVWVVVNKLRPYEPIEYSPADLVIPVGVRDLAGSPLRADAGTALAAMIAAAATAGAGEVALSSGFRSYGVQQRTYASQVDARGTEGADLVSARPGHSEHQSGLAADVVACADGGCGGLDTFAGTPQAAWVAEHAWEFGWVVRYEDGATGVSGYSPEPWHLRYLGTELAAAYHAGGFHAVEEFLGLPAAPHYAD